jgi:hypothetical protein
VKVEWIPDALFRLRSTIVSLGMKKLAVNVVTAGRLAVAIRDVSTRRVCRPDIDAGRLA